MRIAMHSTCWAVLLLLFHLQSLVDIARDEAERRRHLEEQGIEAKIIDGNAAGPSRQGNITTSTESGPESIETPARPKSTNKRESIRVYRAALQKLDRAIQQYEARLASKRVRLQTEKWPTLKASKASRRIATKDPQIQLRTEIEELEVKLKQLREERLAVYEEGKKAGFLPGELEGKGLIP